MDGGVYFDIDGTLITSTADVDALITTAEQFGISIDDEARQTHDQLVAQFFRRNYADGYRRATEVWCEHYGFDIDPIAFTRELQREKIESTRVTADLDTVLPMLADNGPLGILTNGGGDIQRGKLQYHGIEHFFDPILISGELDTMKPEDEMFQLAIESLSADHHVYVADRLAFDIVPAQENGLTGVWIAETPSPIVDGTISSVDDLSLETLRELCR